MPNYNTKKGGACILELYFSPNLHALFLYFDYLNTIYTSRSLQFHIKLHNSYPTYYFLTF